MMKEDVIDRFFILFFYDSSVDADLNIEECNQDTTENAIDKMMKKDEIERFFILLSMVVRLTCNSPKENFPRRSNDFVPENF